MIRLPKDFIEEIIAHAREEAPNECGGVLAGAGDRVQKLYKVESSVKSPMTYIADAKASLRVMREIDDKDWTVLALWHSHTHSQGYPSPTDVDVMRAWMGSCHSVIVSLRDPKAPTVRAFLIMGNEITEDEVEVS